MNMEREQLKKQAYELAKALIAAGDFYDVAEEFARGYADAEWRDELTRGGGALTAERSLQLQLGALNELQSVCNTVIAWRVEEARELHMSWSEIGDALDMSKQAAQQRWGKKPE